MPFNLGGLAKGITSGVDVGQGWRDKWDARELREQEYKTDAIWETHLLR